MNGSALGLAVRIHRVPKRIERSAVGIGRGPVELPIRGDILAIDRHQPHAPLDAELIQAGRLQRSLQKLVGLGAQQRR